MSELRMVLTSERFGMQKRHLAAWICLGKAARCHFYVGTIQRYMSAWASIPAVSSLTYLVALAAIRKFVRQPDIAEFFQ